MYVVNPPSDEINNQTSSSNTTQHTPDTSTPDAQIHACKRTTHANFILNKKQYMLLTWDNQRYQKLHMHINMHM